MHALRPKPNNQTPPPPHCPNTLIEAPRLKDHKNQSKTQSTARTSASHQCPTITPEEKHTDREMRAERVPGTELLRVTPERIASGGAPGALKAPRNHRKGATGRSPGPKAPDMERDSNYSRREEESDGRRPRSARDGRGDDS